MRFCLECPRAATLRRGSVRRRERVLETKRRFGLAKAKLVDLNALRFVVGDSSNAQVARIAAEKSITLVRDSLHQIPLMVDTAKVLSITLARRADLSAGNAFNSEHDNICRNCAESSLRPRMRPSTTRGW